MGSWFEFDVYMDLPFEFGVCACNIFLCVVLVATRYVFVILLPLIIHVVKMVNIKI